MGHADAVPEEAGYEGSLVFAEGAVGAGGDGQGRVGHALRQQQEEGLVVPGKLLYHFVHLRTVMMKYIC